MSIILSALFSQSQQAEAQAPPVDSQSATTITVESDLVLVRVVVRDAQGKPVEDLKKEDFKLFDRGKEQSISQFEAISSDVLPSQPQSQADVQSNPQSSAAASPRYIALYFDTLNSSAAEIMHAHDAADSYLTKNLKPSDHVAIFNSEKMLTGFTSDSKQIHDALSKLNASSRASGHVGQCPDISDYQAQEILRSNDYEHDSAWVLALQEWMTCTASRDSHSEDLHTIASDPIVTNSIRSMAQTVASNSGTLARANLQTLEGITKYLAQAPGRRIAIFISPGFLSQSERDQLDRIIETALRSQTVINTLDPKGLAVLMREADASLSNIASTNDRANAATHSLDSSRQSATSDVLVELAQSTGGQFIHNDNDLKAGFDAVAGHPAEYLLGFSPKDLKRDGKYHELKVTLADKQKGATIQARRGYFASSGEQAVMPGATVIQPIPPPRSREAQLQFDIHEALLSKSEIPVLPIGLELTQSPADGGNSTLSALVHLDVKPIAFRQEADKNSDTITFVVGVFDEHDQMLIARQHVANISVTADQLRELVETGVGALSKFQLKPGAYRVRAVVAESEQHKVAATSMEVTVQ